MTDKTMTLEPCPFCGGEAEYKSKRYAGAGASGMEAPYIHAGCAKCNVWFSGGQTEGPWDKEAKQWEDRTYEAHADAAFRWNTRHLSQPAECGEAVEKVEEVAWPNRLANIPAGDGSGDRIVGFRIPDGDPILGEYGLSEPLAWLRKVTIDRELYTAPPPAAGVPDGMVLVAELAAELGALREASAELVRAFLVGDPRAALLAADAVNGKMAPSFEAIRRAGLGGPAERDDALERAEEEAHKLSATPSPTIDVAAVREVISRVADDNQKSALTLGVEGLRGQCIETAKELHKLARAIGDAK